MQKDLARRSIHSSAYNIAASAVQALILFGRSIILARLLEPEIFGIYAYAASFVVLTRSLPRFGLGSALLHRAQESEGETALQTHFTLSLIFGTVWLILLTWVGSLFLEKLTSTVLLVIAVTEFIDLLTGTGRLILIRRVVFRRIAVIQLIIAVTTTAGALWLAWRGFGVWSLVATDIIAAVVVVIGFYLYRPIWRPRLGLKPEIGRYFLRFGSRTFLAGLLLQALDRIDDLWTGFTLGDKQMGFYSRAYTFATYPRKVLASPLNAVAAGTYAELKEKPKRLSQAFFRVNAFLVRSGFLFAGLLALVAPEFIRLVIGVKWLPMLTAFRLMVIYTMLDPIKITIASLFVAVGHPEKAIRARLVQLVVLLIGLFSLGRTMGIAGVALAVNTMLVVGIALLLWQARAHVQFSVRRLFGIPTFALGLGMILARAAITLPGMLGSPWRTGAVKIIVFSIIYSGILLLIERDQISMLSNILKTLLSGDRAKAL
jgi:PST family polysaccharide transporter